MPPLLNDQTSNDQKEEVSVTAKKNPCPENSASLPTKQIVLFFLSFFFLKLGERDGCSTAAALQGRGKTRSASTNSGF